MSDFARQQSYFQRGILNGDDTVLAEILDSPREKREKLFGVYRARPNIRTCAGSRKACRSS
jgi:hypothetical protein